MTKVAGGTINGMMAVDRQYEKPPVSEMVMTCQFAEPLSLSIPDLAAIRALFKDEYPVYHEIPRAGPMRTDPTREAQLVGLAPFPRMRMVSNDLGKSVLFQGDRVSVSWEKVGPDSVEYPRYPEMWARLEGALKAILNWADDQSIEPISPKALEIAYVNTFELISGKRGVSDILKFFSNVRMVPMHQFGVAWAELLRPAELDSVREGGEATGMVYVESGPGASFGEERTVRLELTGSSKLSDFSAAKSCFDEIHDKLIEVFEGAVRHEALRA